ncbi:hypothetical protein LUZ60_006611 [Juncus effusus]|nr:hypothetical protein LUZ60_006611 [Juncus effusus]
MEGLIKQSMEGLIGQETAPTMIPAAPAAEVVEKKKLNVVVAAVDDSEGSHYALSWAIDRIISSRRDDSQLVVLYAQHAVDIFADPVAGHDPLPYAPAVSAAYTPTSVFESMKKANEENSKRIIARAVDICKSKGVNATTAIVEGEPKDALCDAAEQLHADLLVVGSRGLGMLKRAFLGSVSDYVVHHAKCPVLIVKPPKGTPKQKS